jgi:twitching motility protein PilT
MEIITKQLFEKVVESKASDLHLTVGLPPMVRVNTELKPLTGFTALDSPAIENVLKQLLDENQLAKFYKDKEFDFSFSLGERARFRANAFYQKGYVSAAFRAIPFIIPTLETLNLPSIVAEFAKLPRGFVLVTGATGHGKSTTLASMIDFINRNRSLHVITVEDPIEYIFEHDKCVIQQREMNHDTLSWDKALRSALREDPDVVLVGEMRDYETISAAVTIAETGHLVFSTLHTNSAAQSINRLIDVFPEHEQAQVRAQIAESLEGILSQRLIPSIDGKMVPAVEVLITNNAIRNSIREGKTHLIDNIIATNLDIGMVSLERSLADLVNTGKITQDTALSQTLRPDELKRLIKRNA